MPRQLTSDELLALLTAAPLRIQAVTAGVAPALLVAPAADGGWSANEVLAHLRACADVWGGCIATILTQEAPTIRAINPRTWIRSTDYEQQDFGASLEAYAAQRSALIALLKPLGNEAWSRSATVTGAGRPLQRTVLSYAEWLATHERPHIRQIERAIKLKRT